MKRPAPIHAAAATLLLNAVVLLLLVVNSAPHGRYAYENYIVTALPLVVGVLLYLWPKAIRWVAAVWFVWGVRALVSAALRTMDNNWALASLELLFAAWCLFLVYQLAFGHSIRAFTGGQLNHSPEATPASRPPAAPSLSAGAPKL